MRKQKNAEFRPLNHREWDTIAILIRRRKLPESASPLVLATEDGLPVIKVSYETMQGGFCVCVILVSSEESSVFYLYRGASRRSYKDKDKPVRGEMKAFIRTILYSRPQEVGRG